MATGYNIYLPNGSVRCVKASCMEDRRKIANELLDEWRWYCEKNWISSNKSNPYSPENKVKAFLSSLGYFLIMGADDIVTDYKQIMNGKREIPVSSCPSFIEDKVYGGIHVNASDMLKKAESDCFRWMVETIDEKANGRYGIRNKRQKESFVSKSDKIRSLRQMGYAVRSAVVDTENNFVDDGCLYHISESMCPQYNPVQTKYGNLFEMDRVYVATKVSGETVYYDDFLDPLPEGSVIRR